MSVMMMGKGGLQRFCWNDRNFDSATVHDPAGLLNFLVKIVNNVHHLILEETQMVQLDNHRGCQAQRFIMKIMSVESSLLHFGVMISVHTIIP
jgi:hypothetical protein